MHFLATLIQKIRFFKCKIFYREAKRLSETVDHLKKEYQEITDKYTEVIGHNNHKQRIKHLSQLKEKIYKLEQVGLIAFVFIGLYWMWLHYVTAPMSCYL